TAIKEEVIRDPIADLGDRLQSIKSSNVGISKKLDLLKSELKKIDNEIFKLLPSLEGPRTEDQEKMNALVKLKNDFKQEILNKQKLDELIENTKKIVDSLSSGFKNLGSKEKSEIRNLNQAMQTATQEARFGPDKDDPSLKKYLELKVNIGATKGEESIRFEEE